MTQELLSKNLSFDESGNAQMTISIRIFSNKENISNFKFAYIIDIADLNKSFDLFPIINLDSNNELSNVTIILNNFNLLELSQNQFQIYDLTNISIFRFLYDLNGEQQEMNFPVYCYRDGEKVKFELLDP